MAVSREDVLNALDGIVDPPSGKGLVKAGMVEGLVLKSGHISFVIEVPAERGAAAEPLRKQAEEAVAVLPGVLSVTAVLTAHQSAHAAAPSRAAATPAQTGIPTFP